MANNKAVTDRILTQLVPHCINLTNLNLAHCANVGDASVRPVNISKLLRFAATTLNTKTVVYGRYTLHSIAKA